ncbi:unnamed protein product [Rotaria magnacalcarata]|uniref:C3H1-type domain-containing protein n=6 Tax=Rotaria magnacalcarata TaxID=392030 RepID=A0A815F102_9BILA|nr:unnamed protein product [Rotaria magnacalcarata]CAF1921982.1 unnamed protein product [Rotaria magnacalcarata]
MSHTPMKKSVFERIERGGGNSSPSSSTANTSHKSTHGFCSIYIKNGSCPLGDTCKYIHEQPNLDKQQGSKEELRITKTITRVVDMSSPSIKSTVTVSNEQRAVSSSTSIPSSRTVIESGLTSNDQSDRRLSSSDHKQSQRRSSDTKRKSSSNLKESSLKKKTHPSSKNKRSMDSDSPVDSTSDSEYTHSSHKSKKKSDTHSTSTKYKTCESISPQYDEDETLNDQLLRQTQTNVKSPKRTIVITGRKKDENTKRTSKDTKSNPDIEFLGSKIISRDKKSIETIHQQAENNKKSMDIKRERKSPSRSSSDQQKRRSSVTTTNNAMTNDRNMQIKTEDTKYQSNKAQNSSEQSDRSASQSTPPVVQLSPSPSITTTSDILEKGSVTLSNELEKVTSVQPPSPICVILDDDDSTPSLSVEKKILPQSSTIPVKRTHGSDKNSSKPAKRSHDSDKRRSKEKTNENIETKPKRLNDGTSKKSTTSRKTENDNRSTSNRSDSRRPVNTSSRDEPSSRKYKEKPESRPGKSNDSKDRNLPAPPPPPSSSKSRGASDRRDVTRSSPEKKRSTHRRGKEKGIENVTDSEEHIEEPVIPKQSALEAYMSMDWSLLSRDKRIPMNTQVTSRIARIDNSINLLGVSERLLTKEQKEKLNAGEFQSSPLTHFIKQLQTKSSSQIINSCHRRFGSCAKDMIDMRHKWFLRSAEPVQQYEFINKEHYIAFQQAINSLLDNTSNDTPTLPIETTTTTTTAAVDALLS